jgi:hypothetical protein
LKYRDKVYFMEENKMEKINKMEKKYLIHLLAKVDLS